MHQVTFCFPRCAEVTKSMSTNDSGMASPQVPQGPPPPPPYGTPPVAAPPPGLAYAVNPAGPPPGGKGLVITALVVSLVALLLSWVPIINNFAALLAVGGLVLGIVGLVGAARKGRPGKGMAIASVIISLVSLVLVIVTQNAYGRAIDEFVDDLDGTATEQLGGTTTQEATVDEEDEVADAPAAPAVGDVSVVEVAFGQNTYDPTIWWYVVIIDNPNPEHVYPLAGFDVEAVGADGTILDTGSSYVNLLPGRVALTGSFFDVGSNVLDHLDVRGPEVADALHESELGAFAVADVAAASDEWSTKVGGNLSGSFVEEQASVQVDVIARNAQGQIVGSELTFVDRLPVGGQARFEVTFLAPLPADTTYEVYPSM
ncbi:DUF4190 domain-containing protein [Cellulomonas sp. S1-8]|uniref:DUF4190 domain-containing protein n=1 Tax=Cellulomonas sp. S1-8 TaxID=2904790 RepID=UPI002244B958|nr:DUF4190 domain-containing protein [Cellulomonas sp. S1-8]UZN03026.1 DUF4190 domain-containing protein [Cellulomonas sp. S1-8]